MKSNTLYDIELRKEIRQLSSLLSGSCPGVPESEAVSDFSLVAHFANLLSIKRKQDVAVTGSINPDGTPDAAIFVSSNSTSSSKQAKQDNLNDNTEKDILKESYARQEIEPSNITAEEVTQLKFNPTLSLEVHARDVLAVLKLSHEGKILEDEFHDWMVARSWTLLQERLAKGSKVWRGCNLVQLLQKYKPLKDLPYGEVEVNSKQEEELFCNVFKLTLVRDRVFSVDSSTARQWVLTIAGILNTITKGVEELENPLYEDIKMTGQGLRLLQFILKQPPVMFLLENSRLSSLSFPQIFSLDRSKSKKQDGDEDEDPDRINIEVNDATRIHRYLRTLIAWHDSVTYILSRRKLLEVLASVQPSFTQIYADPRKDEKSQISQSLKQDICERVADELSQPMKYDLRERIMDEDSELSRLLRDDMVNALDDVLAKRVLRWIDEKTVEKGMGELEKPCQVHAEAALMACAYHANSSGIDKALQAETVNIGVSKKCCYLCWHLYQLIRSSEPMRFGHLRVSSTHGVLYPWDVPPWSIPTGILVQLKKDLISRLIKQAGSDIKMHYDLIRKNTPTPDQFPPVQPTRSYDFKHLKGMVMPW